MRLKRLRVIKEALDDDYDNDCDDNTIPTIKCLPTGSTVLLDLAISKNKNKRKKIKANCINVIADDLVDIEGQEIMVSKKKKLSSTIQGIDTAMVTPVTDSLRETEVNYPYTVDDDDHCESPREAYEDITGILSRIAKVLGKTAATLTIYDPYFCEGTMVRHLHELGFESVYNRKEDFYAKISDGTTPDYDVLVTNPPYSSNHVSQLLDFCIHSNKPWFLLVPNYVYMKDYYLRIFNGYSTVNGVPFYIAPKKRYLYSTPKGRRQMKSAKYTSPFPTFWYCNLKCDNMRIVSIQTSVKQLCLPSRVDVSMRVPSFLPPQNLTDSDPVKKKFRNADKRRKNKDRKKNKIGL
jgi:hypothetical protein